MLPPGMSGDAMNVVETSEGPASFSVGKCCRLLSLVRDRERRTRFREKPRGVAELDNLDRRMFLVWFEDGATTFVIPSEIVIAIAGLALIRLKSNCFDSLAVLTVDLW